MALEVAVHELCKVEAGATLRWWVIRFMRVLALVLPWFGTLAAAGLYLDRQAPRLLPAWSFFVFLGFGVLSLLYSTAQTAVGGWVGHRLAQQVLDILLQDLGSRLRAQSKTPFGLRCNVMMMDRGFLRIVATGSGPAGATPTERALRWAAGDDQWQGGCGRAVQERRPVALDLSEWRGKPFEAILHEDGQPRWGMTRDQWEHTRDIGSIVSVPLIRHHRVVGVLNVDAAVGLRQWLPGDREDDDFLGWMHSVSGALALLLELRW